MITDSLGVGGLVVKDTFTIEEMTSLVGITSVDCLGQLESG